MPQALVLHAIAGRMRFRVPEKRLDRGYFDRVADAIRAIPGVHDVQTNAVTGSILVIHATDDDKIIQTASSTELFSVSPTKPRVLPTVKVQQALRSIDGRITSATRGGWDFNSILMVMCAVAGGVQMFRQNIWPAGASLFWYAMTLAVERNDTSQQER